ncbi:MAG: tRNA-(ms[2]io[6]A)-hydroxylase [Bacteroidota bacterium]|nr:tRNA-(ms[2]io[6]A)-hydroxylase [Bacteroidota bacterium]MDP4230917.1 tRNA-(ms[2]io[6]A)-hydroxylase [Bacteroidota bacterium]MDP4236372.1 tRNA-(ms[2]io[6]A)-hydroxylase [Bacteroidota bacterium]
MLGLQCESNKEWIGRVAGDPAILLCDHAHCEKKAALMAISLLNNYPSLKELVEEMSELAIEEMSHFRMVLKKMDEHGVAFAYDPGDLYAQALHSKIHKHEKQKLLDRLIVASLIEARSCERFQLLSEHAADEDLREFYRSLLASEARHRNTFLRLARLYFPAVEVAERLREFEDFEAELVASLPSEPVMHG